MKKLMVALAAIAMAVAAQAGTINWAMTNVYLGNSTTTADGCIAYLLVGSLSDPAAAITDTASALTFVAQNNTYGEYAYGDATGKFAYTGSIDYAAASATVYAIVFNASSIENATGYYVSKSTKDVEIPGSGIGTVNFGTQKTNSQDSANWTSIAPEPTSGMMLLLGMGVLALRRRRA